MICSKISVIGLIFHSDANSYPPVSRSHLQNLGMSITGASGLSVLIDTILFKSFISLGAKLRWWRENKTDNFTHFKCLFYNYQTFSKQKDIATHNDYSWHQELTWEAFHCPRTWSFWDIVIDWTELISCLNDKNCLVSQCKYDKRLSCNLLVLTQCMTVRDILSLETEYVSKWFQGWLLWSQFCCS